MYLDQEVLHMNKVEKELFRYIFYFDFFFLKTTLLRYHNIKYIHYKCATH